MPITSVEKDLELVRRARQTVLEQRQLWAQEPGSNRMAEPPQSPV